MVRHLLRHGAEVNVRDHQGRTPLHVAAYYRFNDIMALLLRHGADYLVEDDDYCSAAQDFQDARTVCEDIGIPLHHINFAAEYREKVFADFAASCRCWQ